MKLDYLKVKKELVSNLLLGVSAFLAFLILVKVTGFFTASANPENIVKRAIVQNNTDTKDMDKYFAKYKALADELKKKNLFTPPPPKQHPVKEVLGILGNEVLIKDKWYKVDETVGDAKIVAIGPTQVTIEWEGKKKVFLPIDATVKGSQAEKAVVKVGKADMVVIQSGRESISDREGKSRGEKQKGEKQRGDTSWARKMSMDELRRVRGKIAEHIDGLRAKGVRDPAAYEGAMRKMEAVEGAIWERGGSK